MREGITSMSTLITATFIRIAAAIESMKREAGQGLVEYALIIVLVSIACIIVLTALGVKVAGVFSSITGSL